MKKITLKTSFKLILLSSLIFTACKKEDDDHDHDHSTTDTSKPTITMSSPTNMKMYNNGDTVKIIGLVEDASLHELVVKIIKDSDGSVLFQATPTVHDLTSYSINQSWKSQVSDHTNATVVILAEDHSANVASDSLHIHIMP
ncbi:MAG: hypothetical protein IT245_05970 [Bacteroidia bacterium]|nr:hypothetical protein [Bacteroidia bacterium]